MSAPQAHGNRLALEQRRQIASRERGAPPDGRAAHEAPLEQARQLSGARSVRVLRPGRPQAMNYSSGRLNVEVDSSGRIAHFSCG